MSNPQSSEFRPTAILETSLYCRDLLAARKFYEQVIGLTLHAIQPDRHLFFRVGGGMLLVFHPDICSTVESEVDRQKIPLHGANGASHAAFTVDAEQFAAIRVNLANHDVPIESEVSWPNGAYSIYCRDPAGNSIEFATRNLWFEAP